MVGTALSRRPADRRRARAAQGMKGCWRARVALESYGRRSLQSRGSAGERRLLQSRPAKRSGDRRRAGVMQGRKDR